MLQKPSRYTPDVILTGLGEEVVDRALYRAHHQPQVGGELLACVSGDGGDQHLRLLVGEPELASPEFARRSDSLIILA